MPWILYGAELCITDGWDRNNRGSLSLTILFTFFFNYWISTFYRFLKYQPMDKSGHNVSGQKCEKFQLYIVNFSHRRCANKVCHGRTFDVMERHNFTQIRPRWHSLIQIQEISTCHLIDSLTNNNNTSGHKYISFEKYEVFTDNG